MAQGLVESGAQPEGKTLSRIYGVTVAQVIGNLDATGLGRVQLRLPWLPGVEPWARVAVMASGAGQGTFFIPQVGDEVLVAFNQGDVREPYVVGSLWNGIDRPPAAVPTDAVNKRIVRTPKGHVLEFDDLAQTITVKSTTGHEVKIGPEQIELSAVGGTATVTLGASGNVTIQAALRLELKAPSISIQGNNVEVKGTVSALVDGGLACAVKAGMVKIN